MDRGSCVSKLEEVQCPRTAIDLMLRNNDHVKQSEAEFLASTTLVHDSKLLPNKEGVTGER